MLNSFNGTLIKIIFVTHTTHIFTYIFNSGIRIPRKLFDTTTLEEMGVNQDKIQAITVFLRNNHHIDISEEDILALTIQQ